MNYTLLSLVRELNEDIVREEEKGKRKKRNLRARQYQKKRRQRNPERVEYLEKRWRKNNPDKIRLKAFRRQQRKHAAKGTFTKEGIQRILAVQKNLCLKCKKPFTEDRPYTIDHIVPLSKGGSHDLSNLQLLHRKCNSEKHIHVIDYRTRIMKRRIFEQLPLWTAGG